MAGHEGVVEMIYDDIRDEIAHLLNKMRHTLEEVAVTRMEEGALELSEMAEKLHELLVQEEMAKN